MSVDRRTWLVTTGASAAGLLLGAPLAAQPVTRRRRQGEAAIELGANENPYGPGERARAAIRAAAELGTRYPRGDATALRDALAARHQVAPDSIVLTHGSRNPLVSQRYHELPRLDLLLASHDLGHRWQRPLLAHPLASPLPPSILPRLPLAPVAPSPRERITNKDHKL